MPTLLPKSHMAVGRLLPPTSPVILQVDPVFHKAVGNCGLSLELLLVLTEAAVRLNIPVLVNFNVAAVLVNGLAFVTAFSIVPFTVTTVVAAVVLNVPLPLTINFAPTAIDVVVPGVTTVLIVTICVLSIATFGEALVGTKVAGYQFAPELGDASQVEVFDQSPLVLDSNQLPGLDDKIIVCTPPATVVVATAVAAVEKVRLAKAIAGVACMVLFVTAPAATSAVTQK